jgi:5-methylthioadenosine/S-adenosylhomocysteine deaminase
LSQGNERDRAVVCGPSAPLGEANQADRDSIARRRDRAKAEGLLVALGPDWSSSGSKNVLGELKIARLVSNLGGDGLSDFELLSLATRSAAKVLRWDTQLGQIEAGKRADLLVVSGDGGDGHAHLFTRSEHDVELVVVNGVPRYGASRIMRRLQGEAVGETGSVGGRARLLDLAQPTAGPFVGELTLGEATELLTDRLKRLLELAKDMLSWPAVSPEEEFLVLDHDELDGFDVRPHMPSPDGTLTANVPGDGARSTPFPDLLEPLTLDALTVFDDSRFVDLLAKESNLPPEVAAHVPELY